MAIINYWFRNIYYVAQWKSMKALTIIFIIFIVLTNVGLIFKIVRRNSLNFTILHDARKLTIISLAIGDIFFALFYLVILARILFRDNPHLTCNTEWSANVYGEFLIHFVYGTGLVVLAAELIYRLRRPISHLTTSIQSNIIAFIISAIPWVLGLIIILPLTMAGMDWDTCINSKSTLSMVKAWYAVSLCLPASLALLAGLFAMYVTQSSNPSPAAFPLSQIPPQYPTPNNSYESSTQHMQTQPISVQGHQLHQYPYPQAPYQYPPAPYPVHVHNQPPNHPQHAVTIPQPLHNLPPDFTNLIKEKGTLLLVCIAHFICVIPYAGFYLGFVYNEDREPLDILAYVVLHDLFCWLLICRSVLTPLIWICRLDD